MNRHFKSASRLASILIPMLTLVGGLSAQSTSLSGPFGFLLNVSYSNPSDVGGTAILGLMNFDGSGNVSGSFTLEYGSGGSLPVETIPGTLTGTYSTTSGGAGSMTLALSNGMSLVLDMVIDGSGHGLQLAVTSCSGGCDLTGILFNGVGEAQYVGAPPPSNGRRPIVSPRGAYGFQFNNTPFPGVLIGVDSFDSGGNFTMSFTFVGSGGGIQPGTFTGTYAVNSDGTGTITIPPQGNQEAGATYVFVAIDGGTGILLLQTNRAGNGVSYGTARLQ